MPQSDFAAPLEHVLATCHRNRERDLAELFTLLRQPSISTQGVGVLECAALVADALTTAGFAVDLIPNPGFPIIYGERCSHPDAPTVLIYGHYDVQPPDPLDGWQSPPFEPMLRNERIYARGAGDNKGQFFAQICAARAWMETTGDLPVNVKFLIEGEEENGSPYLDKVVATHRELLACDLVYTSDGPVIDDAFPCVVYGVRGVLSLELRVQSANNDLHSGNWGGVAPNAAWQLVHLLGTMLDTHNEITIEGVWDNVAPISPATAAAIANLPFDTTAALAGIGVDNLPPPTSVGYFERLMTRPTLTINGLMSGYQGAGSKTVIPASAVAKLDLRLVPNQTSDQVLAAVVAHVKHHAPSVTVIPHGRMEPSATPLDHPLAAPVRRAVERGFGQPPVDVPLLGGSLPDAVWTQTLGVPSFLVPYANVDERNHASNENIMLERFYAGIRTCASLFAELAGQQTTRTAG